MLIVVLAGNAPVINLTALAMLMIWTAIGMLGMYGLLWDVTGKEIICIDGKNLLIRRSILGIGRATQFHLEDVRRLRFYPWNKTSLFPLVFRELYWRRTWKSLVFNYGSRLYHFGIGLDEREAGDLLKTIVERFPDVDVSQ